MAHESAGGGGACPAYDAWCGKVSGLFLAVPFAFQDTPGARRYPPRERADNKGEVIVPNRSFLPETLKLKANVSFSG